MPSSTPSSKTVIGLTHSSPGTSLIYSDCHCSCHGQFFATDVIWLGMEWRRNVHNLLCWASTSSKKSITALGHHCIPAIGYHHPTASLHPCHRVPLSHSITASLPQGTTAPQHHCPMPWHHGITACPGPWLLILYSIPRSKEMHLFKRTLFPACLLLSGVCILRTKFAN